MDADRFDALAKSLRPDGVETGRRRLIAAFAAVAASLLLPSARIEAGAASRDPVNRERNRREGHRQRHRKDLRRRRHEQRQDHDGPNDPQPNWRGISLLLGNPNTSRTTTHVECGEVIVLEDSAACSLLAVFDIVPGQQRLFDTSAHFTYCWVANRYWFEVRNPFIGAPNVDAAFDGSGGLATQCHPGGTLVLNSHDLSEGQSVSPSLAGHTFTIKRLDDKSDFKYFTVTLAPDL